jgi:hypothetical protein
MPHELALLWRWQWRLFVFYGVAIAVLGVAVGLMLAFGDLAWVRRTALGVLSLLLVCATALQFRQRCPRCRTRLGAHGRLFLPEQCCGCGVAFHPSPVAGHSQTPKAGPG